MKIYNQTAYNPNMNIRHRAQVLNDRILHFTINAIIYNNLNYIKFISKVFTMLFCTMSRTDHNIRKNPILSCIFQPAENFVPKRNFKILNLSKNTLQNLTVTNAKANVPNLTTVRNFVPYGTILKGERIEITGTSQRIRCQMLCRIYTSQ